MTDNVGVVDSAVGNSRKILCRKPNAETFAELDEKIEAALKNEQLEELQILRAQRNELSHASTLPPEILCAIFAVLVDEYREIIVDGTQLPQHFLPSLKWITVTHVCQQWRDAGLNASILWTLPCFQSPDCAAEMLRRAGSVPLTVTFELAIGESIRLSQKHRTKREDVMVKALQGIKQIESLCISQHDSQIQTPNILHLAGDVPGVAHSAPLLHTFTLFSAGRLGGVLPESLFQHNAPRLRHLQLKNWTLPWTETFLLPFSSLTSLAIQYQGVMPVNSPLLWQSALQAVTSLRFLPNLETLYLNRLFDFMKHDGLVNTPEGGQPIVILPKLKFLYLRGHSNVITWILSYIEYPSTANVELEESYWFSSAHRILAAQTLAQRLQGDIRYLSFRQEPPRAVTASSRVPQEGLSNNHSQFCYISLRIPDASVCEALPLESLELFELSITCNVSIWSTIGRLKNVRTLDVTGEMIKSLTGFLLTTALQPGAEVPFFPALKHLIFRRLAFVQRLDDEQVLREEQRLPPNQLKYCIQARKKFGIPIECLELNDCVVPAELIRDLLGLVPSVVAKDTVMI